MKLEAEAATASDVVATHPADRAAASGRSRWRRYATGVLVTDALAIYLAVLIAYVVRIDSAGIADVSGAFAPSYLLVSIALMWAWLGALLAGRTQDRRFAGSGPMEYQRIFSVSWRIFASVAIVAYMFRMEIARGYLGIAFPLGLILLLSGRFCWRRWLISQRVRGELQSRVVIVGHHRTAAYLAREIQANPAAGFRVLGICVPSNELESIEPLAATVLGPMEDAPSLALRLGADTVTVVGSDAMTEQVMRRFGWELEGTGIDLALTVPLRDVSGPRVVMQPVNGLPMMYVDEPRFSGAKYGLKLIFDWTLACALTVLLSPVLVLIAVLVKTSSRGPVLYRQHRVGFRGELFTMLKFRSMYTDSDVRLSELRHLNEGNAVLFKLREDPRVTRIGRYLRRFSLDELPQLINVLRGEMSLVGPRPPLPSEVEQYENHVHRRLLVKPGITGLWQVSGRSDLTWEESVRLDLYYAENWTIFGDILILVRTARAILSRQGAY